MEFTQLLFEKSKHIWDLYIKHPFLAQMSNNSLDIEKFKFYMLQDYLYLKDYMKVFAITLTKADNFDDMKFLCDNMYAILDETYRTHIPYMKKLGISDKEIQAVSTHIDNNSYTKYMLYEAQMGDVLSGLISILSCSWSYAYIAKTIVENNNSCLKSEFYGEWFKGYYSKEYQENNNILIEKINKLSKDLSKEKQEKLIEIFVNCSIYELKFWDMAYNYEK